MIMNQQLLNHMLRGRLPLHCKQRLTERGKAVITSIKKGKRKIVGILQGGMCPLGLPRWLSW